MFYSKILDNKGDFNSSYLQSDIKNLLDTTVIFPANFSVTVFEVTSNYVARPDLLAHDIYGDEMYADIICKINGISNPYEVNEGDLIICPQIEELERFYVNPNSAWKEQTSLPLNSNDTQAYVASSDGLNSLPIPKSKNQSRRPNEAVTGDVRFNIDPISKIVIY